MRMLRPALALIAVALLAGCSSSGPSSFGTYVASPADVHHGGGGEGSRETDY